MNLTLPEVDKISHIFPKPLKIKEKEKKIIQPVDNIQLCYKDIVQEFYTEDLIELYKYAKDFRKLERVYGRTCWGR